MNRLFRIIRSKIFWFVDRIGYARAKAFGPKVPLYPIAFLPDGFKVTHGGKTNLSLIDNFVTADEASYLIEAARNKLTDSRITIGNKRIKDDYRTSQTALVFDPDNIDKEVLPLLYRASMLLGVPHTHVESVYVTRYREGEYYKAHQDFYKGFDGDRLYTILIYLNDVDDHQGGGTVFEKLNIGVRPRLGRAVLWTNTNPDGSHHEETSHEALPVENGGEKWAIQLWFRKYKLIDIPETIIETPQTKPGKALEGDEDLPTGAWAPGEPEPGSAYYKAFN